jgi:DivIVA domain-containing protein
VARTTAIEELGNVTFGNSLRGYDKHDVDAFLSSVRRELGIIGSSSAFAFDNIQIVRSLEAVNFGLSTRGYNIGQVDSYLSRLLEELAPGSMSASIRTAPSENDAATTSSRDLDPAGSTDDSPAMLVSRRVVTYRTTRTPLRPRVAFATHVILLVAAFLAVSAVGTGGHRDGPRIWILAIIGVALLMWFGRLFPLMLMKCEVTLKAGELHFDGVRGARIYKLSDLESLDKGPDSGHLEAGVGRWAVFNFGAKGSERVPIWFKRCFAPFLRQLQAQRPGLPLDYEWGRTIGVGN